MFTVWAADLNSLYDEVAREPVVVSRVETEQQALSEVAEISDHNLAAWYVKS